MPIKRYDLPSGSFEWIDIEHPTPDELQQISHDYELGVFSVLDCLEPDHLPKFESFDGKQFIITRIYSLEDEKAQTIQALTSKIAIFYSDKFVITIHRRSQPFIDDIYSKYVKNQVVTNPLQVVSYLVKYIVGSFEKPVLNLMKQVDDIEAEIFLKTVGADALENLYYIKRNASLSKKLLLLSDEILTSLEKVLKEEIVIHVTKDLHLKLVNLYDQVLEDVNNLLNIYMSMQAQKTNDVMKILTIFSVFFMPLTLISGIYGMNFQFMPELNQPWGYPMALSMMLGVSTVIYFWFKRKRWF